MGEKGKDPQASPTFPELCCHSEEDMIVMSERELVSFKTTEEDRKLAERRDQSVLDRKKYERKTSFQNGLRNGRSATMQVCLPNSWSREVPGHTCGGEQVFTTGYMDYKEKIKKTMDELDYINDPEALNKCEELKPWISPAMQ